MPRHAAGGRTVSVGPYEQTLTDARARQSDPAWVADYRATAPKSSASSAISCAAHTADDEPGSAAPPASTLTSGS